MKSQIIIKDLLIFGGITVMYLSAIFVGYGLGGEGGGVVGAVVAAAIIPPLFCAHHS